MHVFHLAIPVSDLDAAEAFYARVLGAEPARRYEDRVTLRFFDHQLVCHLAPDDTDAQVRIYPRHFGITFLNLGDFDAMYARCVASGYPLVRERFKRWPNRRDGHETFFIADPSNNVIEFKHYDDPSCVF
jgi:hypothetical protein